MAGIIDVDGLCFGYDKDHMVLSDIDLHITKPGFVCVIGPNGVGKSTLIKCISGHIRPTSGTVRIFGRPVSDYSLKELSKVVGYVPVMSSDFNVATVLDTVLIGRYSHQTWRTTPADLEVSYKALEAMEIEDLAMKNFNELSAGQHQKVSIARGLVQEPKILILDEPTSNLDVRHQMYVSAFLKRLCERSDLTVLMISHDLNLSAKFADEVVVMKKPGMIYGHGSPKEMITEEMVNEVYDVECEIIDDHGAPHVVLEYVLRWRQIRILLSHSDDSILLGYHTNRRSGPDDIGERNERKIVRCGGRSWRSGPYDVEGEGRPREGAGHSISRPQARGEWRGAEHNQAARRHIRKGDRRALVQHGPR